MNTIIKSIRKNINLSNPFIYGLLYLCISFYGPKLIGKLPDIFMKLVNNLYFRTLISLTIVYITTKNLKLALAIAIMFCLYVSYANIWQVKEHYKQYQEYFENMNKYMTKTKTETNSESKIAHKPEVVTETEVESEDSVKGYSTDLYSELDNFELKEDSSKLDIETNLRNKKTSSIDCFKKLH